MSRVDGTSRKGYTGNNYKLVDNDYRYVIKYFTANKNNELGDINDKIDELKQIFSYLELVNFKDGKVYSKLNRINDITVTVDSSQYGVGGDLQGQAFVRDKYQVKAGQKQML